MKKFAICLAVFALASCDSKSPTSSETEVAADENAAGEASPEPPTPNYVEHRKGIYYYAEAVSENDQKNGKAAGDVHGFRYLGKNADGEMTLSVANYPSVKFTCADPCKVIHGTTGQNVEFSPNSVIGGAFTDAMNGLLEVDKRK